MLAQKIAYNTVISSGARVLGAIIALVNIGLITRYLGKDLFGEYVTILTFGYSFSAIADLGLYSILVRDISRPLADEKKIASNIFSLRLVSLAVAWLVAIIVVFFLPYSLRLKEGVVIGAFSFFFLSSSQVLVGIFQKYLKMERVALAEIFGRLLNLFLVIVFIYFRLGFFWIILALVFGGLLNFLVTFFSARRFIPVSLEVDLVFWKKTLKEVWPIAVSLIFTFIYFKIGIILLSIMKPLGDVGLYGVAYKVLENIIFFPAMFVGLVMPILSREAALDIEKFKLTFQRSFDVLMLFAFPVMAGIILLAHSMILLLGGPAFLEATSTLKILAFAIGIIFLGNLFGNSIIALGRQRTAMWIYMSAALFNVAVNLIVIPRYSYLGLAVTTIFTELFVTILMLALVYKTIQFFPNLIPSFKALISAAIMYFILDFAGLNLFLAVILGALVYFLAVYLLGAIKKEDLLILFSKNQQF